MAKKKGKSRTASKKTAKKKPTPRKSTDPARVREEISRIVKSKAKKITVAVADQAMHGDLAPAKYLFEMAGVYPAATSDGSQATAEEECLAKTLLDRLNIPTEPIAHGDDEEPVTAATAARSETAEGSEDEEEDEEDESKEEASEPKHPARHSEQESSGPETEAAGENKPPSSAAGGNDAVE